MTGDSKLTFIHDDFDGEAATYQSAGPGWNPVLSGLEALLEAGRPVALGSAWRGPRPSGVREEERS